MLNQTWRAGLAALAASALCACQPPAEAPAPPPPVDALVLERDVAALQAAMAAGDASAETLTLAYMARIASIDSAGPTLNAVLDLNPNAAADARARDAERKAGQLKGPLHGVAILVKDNIETADPLPTTAGSLALIANQSGRDAPAIARLRAAGAVILGKTNLSEWANFRSTSSISGWSTVGGLTRNPYALDRNACGSSSGSGAAVAASLAAFAIGSETDGSITCPAAVNGIVGVKPTVGLVSRAGVVPLSASQDTLGPMARTVRDAALALTVMAGTDPGDPATSEADVRKTDYVAALDPDALQGARIGVARFLTGNHRETDARFEEALAQLRAGGAELVDLPAGPDAEALGEAEYLVLLTEFKVGLDAYLAAAPPAVATRSLADVIAFNAATPRALALFDQDILELAQATKGLGDPGYRRAKALAKRLAGPEGIDRMVARHRLDAIVAPTTGPTWPSDVIAGDRFLGSASQLAAVAGYPHVTVPMGAVRGLPVGLSLFGPAWSEARLLALAFAFEARSPPRAPPQYPPTLEDPALSPLTLDAAP